MAELLFSELRTLINEVATCEATIKDINDKLEVENKLLVSINDNEAKLSVTKEELSQEVNKIELKKNEKNKTLIELNNEKEILDLKIKNYDVNLKDLKLKSKELLEASSLSPEIQEALAALDRRQLSEISKLGSPPIIVKQALEILMVFIDIFGGLNNNNNNNLGSFDNAASRSSSAEENVKFIEPKNIDKKFKKEIPWSEIRKFMAVDIRPQVVGITPELISNYELSIEKLRKMMNSMNSNKISKASKPTGILYEWCKAMLECAYSIQQKKNIDNQIITLENEFPNFEISQQNLNNNINEIENDINMIDVNYNIKKNELDECTQEYDDNDSLLKETNDNIINLNNNNKNENDKLIKIKNNLKDVSEKAKNEIDEINKQKDISIHKLNELNKELEPIENNYNHMIKELKDLKEKEIELFETSKLPPKVVEKLQTLDRRALSEIARMSSPPKIVQSCLEVVYVFLEVFLTDTHDTDHNTAAAADSSKSPTKSPVKVNNKSNKSSPNKQQKKDGLPHADWPAIRKLLAVDLRPRLLAITPEVVSEPNNEEVVSKLKVKMSYLETKSIEKASKPSGLLWLWCSALVVCDESIKILREVSKQIKEQEGKEKPLEAQIERLKLEINKEETKINLYEELTGKL